MSFAKPVSPLIVDELRRLKSAQDSPSPRKQPRDRFECLIAGVASATLRRLAKYQIELPASH
jgi:hypothetical protein